MAQVAENRETPRPQYPPHDYPPYGGHNAQHSPPQRPESAREESQSSYPPPDQPRQGQYPPAPAPYPPPQQWAGQPYGAYPPPPQSHDMNHPPAGYHYHPPSGVQPSQPMQPDPYRLPPPYPPHAYYPPPHYQQPPAPAPRQRTAIACKYCRKRKIRCSGYDSSPDGRCQNCVRFNQQCLFHPVSSQAAFVPASAVYGPNARAPVAGQGDGQNGQQPMLYGAHGQPLGPAGPSGQPQYSYPPPPHGYGPPPPQHYSYPPPGQYPPPPHGAHPASGPPPAHYEPHAQHPPAPQSDRSDRSSLKRGPPDEDPHNEDAQNARSPHPNAKPRHSTYEGRTNSSSSYDYGHQAPTSPATSTMSYQSYPPPAAYTNGAHPAPKATNSPPAGLTPQSAHSFNSPRAAPADGKTPPPNQPGSAGSSQNGRSGMKVHEMLGNPSPHGTQHEQRGKSDNDMLNKLDGKK